MMPGNTPGKTTGKTTASGRIGALRALTAVIALYAFLLQGFLGGLMGLPRLDANGAGILCLHEGDPASAPDKGRPHTHADCCLAAHAAVAVPPRAPATPLAWPARAVVPIVWSREAAHRPRAPPGAIPRPRGPPVA